MCQPLARGQLSSSRPPTDGGPSDSTRQTPGRVSELWSQPSLAAVLFVQGLHLLAGSSGTADLISIAVVARDQFDCLICFVDNTAAEHALNRGTSKNPALCWLLGSFGCGQLRRPFRQFSACDQSGRSRRLLGGLPAPVSVSGALVRQSMARSSSAIACPSGDGLVGLPGGRGQPVGLTAALQRWGRAR